MKITNKTDENIYHILPEVDWTAAKAAGEYRPESLATGGFIHFSLRRQVERVANAFYRDQNDLLLLEIDQDQLDAEVRFEDLLDEGMLFPHLYGPLNLDAVVGVQPMQRNKSGDYVLPALD
ncbi:MAG: DUF952 domain-containing protein [Chloroflexota bacterium]|nr:DUF952 domain-containing protein [Chloroflexota bacterium]